MPTESFRLTVVLPASPEEIYRAWLDGAQHGAFTGSTAENDGQVGGQHSAWDGYITGTNLALEPSRRIVQSWRTTEFPDDAADSQLELVLSEIDGGTELVLEHRDVPADQARAYEQGWVEHYFEPMKRHFARLQQTLRSMPQVSVPSAPAKKKSPAKPAKAKAKKVSRKGAKPAKKKAASKKSKAKASAKKAKRPAKKPAKSKSRKRR